MSATEILINQIITQALASRAVQKIPGHMMLLTIKCISIITAVIGIGLLMLAFYYWLEAHYSPQQTLVYMAFTLLCVSLTSLIVIALVSFLRKRIIRQAGYDFFKTTVEFYETVIADIGQPLKAHRGATFATAILAGLLVGRKL
jgi:hypothetical protein